MPTCAKNMGERYDAHTNTEQAWRLAAIALLNIIAMYMDGRDDRVCVVRFQHWKHEKSAIIGLDYAHVNRLFLFMRRHAFARAVGIVVVVSRT